MAQSQQALKGLHMLDDLKFVPHGKHLIAGETIAGETTFEIEPASGAPHALSVGTTELGDKACKAAEEAFWSFDTHPVRSAPLLRPVCCQNIPGSVLPDDIA